MLRAAELSIVVVAANPLQVTACVESIAACATLDRTEILLVSALDCLPLQQRFPWLRVVAADVAWSLPRMRAEGLRKVTAPYAAVLSEDYRVGEDWTRAVGSARERGDVLVGEVVPPDAGLFARAAYLWEYLHVAPPAATGLLTRDQARWAPAGAVVYRVDALDIASIAAAHSEMEYHGALFDAGRRFYRDSALRVRYIPPERGFLFDRLRRSREWARSRSAPLPLPLRWLVGVSRIALPVVLVGGFLLRAAVRPRYLAPALAALPFALLFAAAETLGEIEGCFGRTA